MKTENLPTADLKKYGIILSDNTFTTKLSPADKEKFLQGQIIIADNSKNRATFKLTDNLSRLEVKFYQRDKSLEQIFKESANRVVYVETALAQTPDVERQVNPLKDLRTAVFIANKETGEIIEYDLLRDMKILTGIIGKNKSEKERNRYRMELLKMKAYLQQKIEKFPEIAKAIKQNLNVISNEIKTVATGTPSLSTAKKQNHSKITLDVNDPDLYEDANRNREIANEEESLNRKNSKGRGL